ncbi:hypothetical protein O181_029758 [Austropuccinia psidii MF-1]|uniref:Uncharacterized protein n=1 Tax=Austropuccinia psidii MF-1 TaxID=1389203 RepID=A0A9Q3H315_9BASI|nr:hypothetical protein [Austropuccinia psidii MF-1]
MLVMLADKHTRKACLLSDPSNCTARGVATQDALVRTPLWLKMMNEFPSGNGHWDPKQEDRKASRQLDPCPQVLICPPPSNGHFTPQLEGSDYPANEGWQCELTLPPFVEPSQHHEPPIPGPSQPSEPHEDTSTCEPEPEVAPTQSMEENFVTPASAIIIDNMPVASPLLPSAPKSPNASSPHSHDKACQEHNDLQPTLMIPQAIIHKSINQILLEHCRLLHMVPFMDATHGNEMHWEFQEELNLILGLEPSKHVRMTSRDVEAS